MRRDEAIDDLGNLLARLATDNLTPHQIQNYPRLRQSFRLTVQA